MDIPRIPTHQRAFTTVLPNCCAVIKVSRERTQVLPDSVGTDALETQFLHNEDKFTRIQKSEESIG